MRIPLATALVLTLTLPAALPAEVVLRPHDPAAAPWTAPETDEAPALPSPKLDQRAEGLFVPFYEVDTTDPAGTTTLFAVRNATSVPVTFVILYRTLDAITVRDDFETLGAGETLTVNVRDVTGLPVDSDGLARGYIFIRQTSDTTPRLVGDYLQVDVAESFATGERMVANTDFCGLAEIRFADFGADTELRLLMTDPQGADPQSDPASVTVRAFDEDGILLSVTDVFTDQASLELAVSDFTAESFGTVVISFLGDNDGAVYAEYSAEGKFSTGLNGICRVQ